MGMFIIQMFNMFACKCRMKLPFGKHVLINRYTWVSVLVGALFVGFIVYTPPLNGNTF
jgi:sodium/potassium-transporting ATPase subunit alpha